VNTDVALSVLAFMATACGVTAVAARYSGHRGPVVVAFAVHLAIGLAVLAGAGLYFPDAAFYDQIAREYVAFWNHLQSAPPNFALGKEGWVLILAGIYRWFGAEPVLGIVFNAALTGVTAAIVMATTGRLGWPQHAKTAGWLILMPGFLYSSTLLRESSAWTLTALAAWAAAGLAAHGGLHNTLWLLASFAGMLWIRGSLAVPLTAALLVGLLLARKRVPPMLVVGLSGALLIGGPLVARTEALWGGAGIENINASRSSLSTAASGFETTVYSTPADLVRELPLTLPRGVLGPYPWELSRLPPTALLDWLPWLLLLFWSWRGWRRDSGRNYLQVAVPAFCILAVLGATSGNYGTMIRLRSQAAVLLLPLAAVGVRHRRAADPPTGSSTAARHASMLPRSHRANCREVPWCDSSP
jgi:hypothetical protein